MQKLVAKYSRPWFNLEMTDSNLLEHIYSLSRLGLHGYFPNNNKLILWDKKYYVLNHAN